MKIHAVLSMLVFLMLFTGCDMFRKIAGRPTSAELEAMKEEIVAADAKIQELKSKQQRGGFSRHSGVYQEDESGSPHSV